MDSVYNGLNSQTFIRINILLLIQYWMVGISLAYHDIRFHRNFHLLPTESCGQNNDPRIVGGSVTRIGQYPWMARIGYKVAGCPDKTEFRCGGSLITQRHVITAAHCVHNLPDTLCKSQDSYNKSYVYLVRLGEHNIKTDPDCYTDGTCAAPVQDILVEQAIVHPKYNVPRLRNDIGMVILAEPAEFNTWVQPLCLIYGRNTYKNFINETGFVAGWGITDPATKRTSNLLKQLVVPIADPQLCFRNYKRMVRLSTRQQLCAGGIEGQDSCAGDSGGPLFVIVDTENGPVFSFLGVVSFGFKRCAQKPIPAVYTNVIYYGTWIMNNL